ncbi:MAG: SDR family oxidoreductase [Chloroflexota bacterium]
MKVLVSGGAGFLGSILLPMLLQKGYEVKVLDKFYFRIDSLKGMAGKPSLEIINADTRQFDPILLGDVYAVIDLAAISQPDPQALIDPALYYGINYLAPVRVATLSKIKGVKKYIFPSTCSVYGVQTEIVNETSKINPIDSYAETKAMAEEPIMKLNSGDFKVTILRFATLYGFSPKMRFDLLLNGMTLSALQNNKIMIQGDGEQKRPLVHVRDAAKAIMAALEADEGKVAGQVFNVGNNDQNFKVHEVAELIRSELKGLDFQRYGDPDLRSYHVNFDKIFKVLGYQTEYTPVAAINEIKKAMAEGFKPIDSHWVIRWWVKLSKEGKQW